jgi:hypothetical protein
MATTKDKVTKTKQKKSKEVASMGTGTVRLRAAQLKLNNTDFGGGRTEPKESRTYEDKEVLRRDLDINRRNTNTSSTARNAKGTTTTVNKKGTPSGYRTQTKVTKSDGTTYYKEKKAPYKYKTGGTKTSKK